LLDQTAARPGHLQREINERLVYRAVAADPDQPPLAVAYDSEGQICQKVFVGNAKAIEVSLVCDAQAQILVLFRGQADNVDLDIQWLTQKGIDPRVTERDGVSGADAQQDDT
jgi:hypothetical protein